MESWRPKKGPSRDLDRWGHAKDLEERHVVLEGALEWWELAKWVKKMSPQRGTSVFFVL